MPDYEKMYRELFRATTRAIEILQQSQVKTEELYIASTRPIIELIHTESSGEEDDPI